MANAAKFQEDKSLKKPRAFVISGQVLLVGENVPNRSAMPLSVSDGLPAVEFHIGGCDAHKVPCRFHLDICASMNTGNCLFNKCLVTKYPDSVDSYEQFDYANAFREIVLVGNLDTGDTKDFESGKLTAVVTFKTRYEKVDETPVKVSFGLGSSVDVNSFFGPPFLTDCKMIWDFNKSKAHYKVMQISLPLSLTKASIVLQKLIDFAPADFVRPKQKTSIFKSIHYYSGTHYNWYY